MVNVFLMFVYCSISHFCHFCFFFLRVFLFIFFFFFFSSRRRHTRCGRDWSSDVCSSDLGRRQRTRGIAVNAAGDRGYFGLVGRNSTDDQSIIPFFHANREAALEYDITKLIWNLAHPDKRVVGVISSLPVFGGPVPAGRGRAWTVIEAMREFFEVRNLGTQPERIDEEVSV